MAKVKVLDTQWGSLEYREPNICDLMDIISVSGLNKYNAEEMTENFIYSKMIRHMGFMVEIISIKEINGKEVKTYDDLLGCLEMTKPLLEIAYYYMDLYVKAASEKKS